MSEPAPSQAPSSTPTEPNAFRRLLAARASKVPVGTWVMSASPIVAEAVGCAGYDWAVLDMEHTPLDLMTLVHLLQAVAGTPLAPVVRVPWNDTVAIKRVLDAGAQTLMVPFVQDEHEAARAVAACRYPPDGVRGMAAMGRASRFGTVPDFFRAANRAVSVVVQLETPQAIDRLEAIAAVPGVDAVFVGPGDLSGALGHPGQTGHSQVAAHLADAARRAREAGVPVGIVGPTPQVVHEYLAMGYDYVAVASDLGLMMRALQAARAAIVGEAAAPPASAAAPASAY